MIRKIVIAALLVATFAFATGFVVGMMTGQEFKVETWGEK